MFTMPDQNLSPTQVIQLTKAMLSVACVDDIQPAEAALIGQFYESSRSPEMLSTANFLVDPEARQFDAACLIGSAAAFADTVVLMCLMTGYADGRLSAAELAYVQTIATTLGLDAERFNAHLEQVRDELVGALSHLPDAGSVAVVARELSAVR